MSLNLKLVEIDYTNAATIGRFYFYVDCELTKIRFLFMLWETHMDRVKFNKG